MVCSMVSSLRPRAEWALQFKSKGSWLQNPPFAREGQVLFRSGRQLIGRGPPTLGRAICFACSPLV